jgi:desampylase
MTVFVLPLALRAQLAEEAAAAHPHECCGLIEGRREPDRIVATTLHRARNLARAPDRFEIDPADHFRILRTARAAGTQIIGCYHSHPDGRAQPSMRDREGAGEAGFVWLIAGQGGGLGAYLFDGNGFQPLVPAA